MHKEIFTDEQVKLLPLVRQFSRQFGMVGGTAIALHIGHRRSVDFDLFTLKPFITLRVRKKIVKANRIERVATDQEGQYTVIVRGVRLTFFHYPFPVTFKKRLENVIRVPDLLTLAAMKAFALGRRAKWKDYVDLYFVMEQVGGIKPITKTARSLFGSEFNEKLFRVQLSYFKDIDYSEEVIYLQGFERKDVKIKQELKKLSVS
jgi:hypothetical protein